MIAILDYGIGNVNSIFNMLKKIGAASVITSNSKEIAQADKLILPGVGHFDYCMEQLKKASFFETLQKKVLDEETPVLGVCAGCQMLFQSSEEGTEPGLGWIKGKVVRFNREKMPSSLKIPHMSWTDVDVKDASDLYRGFEEPPRFYFVHSYHVSCEPVYVTASALYGYEFPASVKKGHIMGVQFHPEKSHSFGLQLFQNFVNTVV